MIGILSDSIFSPLGEDTKENFENVKNCISGIKTYPKIYDLDFQVSCSAFDLQLLDREFDKYVGLNKDNYTKLEKASLIALKKATKDLDIDFASSRTKFIFSSTKGNIEFLEKGETENPKLMLWHTANLLKDYLGITTEPIVVSNACISGLCAIIAADREIQFNRADNVIILGADVLSKFVVSGFNTLKALSKEPCKPFDKDRCGLNLGEAAACMVVTRDYQKCKVAFECGAIHNDANHISGPSRTAEGSYNSLKDVLKNQNLDDFAFINTHGTSTIFNDEMESIAVDRMALNDLPLNTLKGYYGHTLGAAGVLEAIISSTALKNGVILKTLGFNELGTSKTVNVTKQVLNTQKRKFVKVISGFGGSNGAGVFSLI